MKDVRHKFPLDQATDLGTVFPSDASWDALIEKRSALALDRNNGEVGRVICVFDNNRGTEQHFAPAINAKWETRFH